MRVTHIVLLAAALCAVAERPQAQAPPAQQPAAAQQKPAPAKPASQKPAVQKPPTKGMDATELAVYTAVKEFLDDLGNRRLDALPARFAPKATLTIVRQQRDGAWGTVHQTVDEWMESLKAQTGGTIFEEPLTNIRTTIESRRLAHLRADFTIVSGGQVRSHGVDHFTLVRSGETWKIASAAFTSIPGAPR